MCRLLTGVLLLLPLTALADDRPAEQPKPGLKPGDNLPGSFLPYNVTGPHKGRFHCLVSDYALEPTVIVFVREPDASDAVRDLLQQLDQRIEKNPAARLHAFAVFFSGDLSKVVADDDKRDELSKRVEDLSNGLGLKHVVLCLDSPDDPGLEKYALGDAWATVVLYDKYRIVDVRKLQKTDGKDKTDQILAEVGEKLRAAKTK
jgi:hypothetical protein